MTPAAPNTPPSGPLPPDMATVVRPQGKDDHATTPVEWALVAYAGAALGRVFPLRPGPSVIGRAPDVTVALLDSEVSRHHAQLDLDGDRLTLEDLGSTNGTRVNGALLAAPAVLQAGDRLAIGGHVLKLVALDPLERAFHETILDLSTRDPLTGLANRGSILGELQTRFGLSLRYGRPLTVVVCDLDRFKQINDTYGHGGGDFALRVFGERLLATLREVDLAGRIGGEEFLMILPETDAAGGLVFAERLRQALAEAPVSLPGGPLEITCSLGVAERRPGELDGGRLLARADAALYRAKAEGRDRVCQG